jgi:hypothetical protein
VAAGVGPEFKSHYRREEKKTPRDSLSDRMQGVEGEKRAQRAETGTSPCQASDRHRGALATEGAGWARKEEAPPAKKVAEGAIGAAGATRHRRELFVGSWRWAEGGRCAPKLPGDGASLG